MMIGGIGHSLCFGALRKVFHFVANLAENALAVILLVCPTERFGHSSIMKQNQKISLQNSQRLTVMGRMRMADWIEMPEREFAGEIAKLEKDPLFQKLYFGDGRIPSAGAPQALARASLPGRSTRSTSARRRSGERVGVEEFAEERGPALAAIKRMGQADFSATSSMARTP